MVIKSTIYELLNKYLGEYLYGFSKDQLEVALISGEIELVNVNFRPLKINKLFLSKNLPISLKCGLIGKLRIKYNYRNWLSNPVEIHISELLLILGPIFLNSTDSEMTPNSEESQSSSNKGFNPFDTSFRSFTPSPTKLPEHFTLPEPRSAGLKEEGFFERYLTGALKNLTLTIDVIHIRYEDEVYPYLHPYSLTLLIDSFEVKTENTEWYLDDKADFKRRTPATTSIVKQGKISGISLHVHSMSGMLIPESLWESTVMSSIGIFEAIHACEVRDLILQQGSLLKSNDTHKLISPFSINFCLGFNKENPYIKFTAAIDKLYLNISSAMGECLRNLKEYIQNVSIWRRIRPFRPFDRIILEPRSESEPESLKETRREIILAWYNYAFLFVKGKMNSSPNEFEDLKMKTQERFTSRASMISIISEEPSLTRRSIFESKPRKAPGLSINTLSEVVKQYNDTLNESGIEYPRPVFRPLIQKPSDYYSKYLQFIEFDFVAKGISVILFDEETKIKSETEIEEIYLTVSTTSEEVVTFIGIDKISNVLKSEFFTMKVLEIGNYRMIDPRTKQINKALESLIRYKPKELKISEGAEPTGNFIEVLGRAAGISLEYSHQSLAEMIVIFETFRTNKLARELLDIDYIKRIEKKKNTLTWKEKFIKKQRQVLHSSVFKKLVLTKKLIRRILQWQGQLKNSLKEIDKKIQPILFNFKLEAGGINIDFLNKDLKLASNISLPSGIFELNKSKDFSKISAWGFTFQTKEPLKYFYKYLLEISTLTTKGFKRMKTLTKR